MNILGGEGERFRRLSPAETVNMFSENINALHSQLAFLQESVNIWSSALLESLEKMLPGITGLHIHNKMKLEVRAALINREANRRRNTLQAAAHFSRRLEELKKQAKEQGLMSSYHEGGKLYREWLEEQGGKNVANTNDDKAGESTPDKSSHSG